MSDADLLIETLEMILEEAQDKEKVKKSIAARLHAAARARDAPKNMSSMDADIDEVVDRHEGDDELLAEVIERMKPIIGGRRRRKTRKVTKMRRKYSRRR